MQNAFLELSSFFHQRTVLCCLFFASVGLPRPLPAYHPSPKNTLRAFFFFYTRLRSKTKNRPPLCKSLTFLADVSARSQSPSTTPPPLDYGPEFFCDPAIFPILFPDSRNLPSEHVGVSVCLDCQLLTPFQQIKSALL